MTRIGERTLEKWLMMVRPLLALDWWLCDFLQDTSVVFFSLVEGLEGWASGEHQEKKTFWHSTRWINELSFFIIVRFPRSFALTFFGRSPQQTSNLMEWHSDWKIPSRSFSTRERRKCWLMKNEKRISHRFRLEINILESEKWKLWGEGEDEKKCEMESLSILMKY